MIVLNEIAGFVSPIYFLVLGWRASRGWRGRRCASRGARRGVGLHQSQELGLPSGGEDGVGELDPVKVEVQVDDGEGFVVDVGVVGHESLLSLR